MSKWWNCGLSLLITALVCSPSSSWAQSGLAPIPDDISSARKAIQNPVSSTIIVFFQNNFDLRVGPYDRTRFLLNVQPVIPTRLSEGWTLTTRVWIPMGYQPVSASPSLAVNGLGDIQPSFLFAPAHPGKLVWAVGPTMLLPTASDQALATGKISAGPALLLLTQPTHWSIGGFVTKLYSISGPSSRRDLNLLQIQQYVNDNLANGWYLMSNPIYFSDRNIKSGPKWTVPVGGGVGRVIKIGPQTINMQLSGYRNVVHPTSGAKWQVRAQLALVYPRN